MKLILSVSLVALFAVTSLTASGQSSQLVKLPASPDAVEDSEIFLFVFDASGAVIPKAQVAVVNHAGKHIAEGRTNGSGQLRLSKLASGTYDVLVQARGFSMSRREGVVVPPHKTVDVEVKLMTGAPAMID